MAARPRPRARRPRPTRASRPRPVWPSWLLQCLLFAAAYGAAARLGLGYEVLAERKPGIIVCDISGYGDDRERPSVLAGLAREYLSIEREQFRLLGHFTDDIEHLGNVLRARSEFGNQAGERRHLLLDADLLDEGGHRVGDELAGGPRGQNGHSVRVHDH